MTIWADDMRDIRYSGQFKAFYGTDLQNHKNILK